MDYLGKLGGLHESASPKNVGEFGCGNGSLLLAFAQKYNIVPFGIDISEPCLDVCKAIHPAHADNFVSV